MKHHWIKCFDCGGHGQVSEYTADGGDFLGAKECNTCGGSGRLVQYKFAVAKWPGGPIVGRLTKQESST